MYRSKLVPVVTLGIILVVGLVLFLGISLLTRQDSASQQSPSFAAAAPLAQAVSTKTRVRPTRKNKGKPTVQVWLGTPNYPTPAPTYAVGPTAQFSRFIPIAEWKTYVAPEGFSVKYPPDWYFETLPQEQELRVNGSTVHLWSYDYRDPNLSAIGKAGEWPPHFTKATISLARPETSGFPVEENETIQDWVYRAFPEDEEKVVSEESVQVDGRQAFRRVTGTTGRPNWSITYLFHGPYIMLISHPVHEEGSFNRRVIQAIVDSIEINN